MLELRDLSSKLQEYILSFCDADELFTCGKVCKAWYDIVVQEEPWYALSAFNTHRALHTTYTLHGPCRPPGSSDGNKRERDNKSGNDNQGRHHHHHHSRSAKHPLGLQFADTLFIREHSDGTTAPFTEPNRMYGRGNNNNDDDDEAVDDVGLYRDRIHGESYASGMGGYSAASKSEAKATWTNKIRCPIPPAPQAASLASAFVWTSIERRFDGGHGGAREYVMRCLRYFSFSTRTCYGTFIGPEDVDTFRDGYGGQFELHDASTSSSSASSKGMNTSDGNSSEASSGSDPENTPAATGAFTSGRTPSLWTGMDYSSSTSSHASPWCFEPTPNPVAVMGGATDLLDELFGTASTAAATRAQRTVDAYSVSPFRCSSREIENQRGQTTARRGTKARTRKARWEAETAARKERFSTCYECKCFRRWQAAQPGGSVGKWKAKNSTTTASSRTYGYGYDDSSTTTVATAGSHSTASARIPVYILSPNKYCLVSPLPTVWSTGILGHLRMASAQRRDRQRAATMDRQAREAMQDGSEGLFHGPSMSISFRVETYMDACDCDRHHHSETYSHEQRGHTVSNALAGCFIGFVEASEMYRFELQPTAASMAAQRGALAREHAGSRSGAGGGVQPRDANVSATTPTSAYSGNLRYSNRHSTENEDDDEVADMLAALADDIQAREQAGGDDPDEDAKLANARRWWSAPPPATTSAAREGDSNGNDSYGIRSAHGPCDANGAENHRTGRFAWDGNNSRVTVADVHLPRGQARASDSGTGTGKRAQEDDGGGIFIGDCPGSYGLNVMDGHLHQNGHAFFLAKPRRGGSCGSRDDSIFTLRFNFEDDCITLHEASGEQLAVVLVDAFSEGQTWMPAVSCRGCGVSVLPPTLST